MSSAAQAYDLSTPAPMPREAARRLDTQREQLAEEMRIHVRRLLRVRVEASVGAADVVRVRHFAGFLDGKAWWFAGGSSADPTARSVLIGCAPDLVYAAIDRQLGGPGSATAPGKPPTTIEFELGMRFLRDLFTGLANALALPPLHLGVAPHRSLAEPLLTYMPDLEEPFARIPWKVKLLDKEHELLLCISRRLLESAEPKREESKAETRELSGPVATAPIELLVELARCALTIDEASQLERGDVVLFDLPPGEPIEVKVQGRTRYRAKLGTHEGRYAVEVVEVVEPAPPAAAKAAVASASANGGGATPRAPAPAPAPAPATPRAKPRTG